MGGGSSGEGDGGGTYIEGELFGGGIGGGSGSGIGGGGGGGRSSSSYTVTSVSKVRSGSSGGARRSQTAGSSGGLSPVFRERKTISSRSVGYDGEILLIK